MPEEFDDEIDMNKTATGETEDKPIQYDFNFTYRNGKNVHLRAQFQGQKINGEYVTALEIASSNMTTIHNSMNRIVANVPNPTVLLTDTDGMNHLINMSEVQHVTIKQRS